MNLYLPDDCIEGLFNKVSENLSLSDNEAPAKRFLLGDYVKVFTNKEKFTNEQTKIFIARAESKYNEEDKDKHKQQIDSYVSECIRLASPVEGVDTIGVFDLNDYDQTDQKDYTFYLGNTEENLTWKLDNNSEENYTILTKWLDDKIFEEESYSSFCENPEEIFKDFLTQAFPINDKIKDIIIYDPYLLTNLTNSKIENNQKTNALFNILEKIADLNIVIFSSKIIQNIAARKSLNSSFANKITFIEIPQNSHDRFILSNYFYITSGKGFALDLDLNLGHDVTAKKIGTATRKTFLEWAEKRNMLQNYLSNSDKIISSGDYKSGILSFDDTIKFYKIIEECQDDKSTTTILETPENKYKVEIRAFARTQTVSFDEKPEITDEKISDEINTLKKSVANGIKSDFQKTISDCYNNLNSKDIPLNYLLSKILTFEELKKLENLDISEEERLWCYVDFFIWNKYKSERQSLFDLSKNKKNENLFKVSEDDVKNYFDNLLANQKNKKQNNKSYKRHSGGQQSNAKTPKNIDDAINYLKKDTNDSQSETTEQKSTEYNLTDILEKKINNPDYTLNKKHLKLFRTDIGTLVEVNDSNYLALGFNNPLVYNQVRFETLLKDILQKCDQTRSTN